ncbi:MAG: alpha/beta hydrolase, partial [Xanthobacteraceae bacterium]
MNTITTKDGVEIYYKDWGPKNAQPIVFHHGWPLSADDWDAQLLYFLGKGYRVIAHDRRGHGRSAQVSDGHDMDHYAADAAAVFEHLDLKNAVHIGHSTGGGEATHYVAKHGQCQGRVAKLVLISAVPPIVVKTPANPGGLPMEVFDGLRKALAGNRAQFYLDFASGPFYGFNRPGVKPIPGVIQNWWRMVQGRLLQTAFYILFFAISGIVIALAFNWRNDRQGYWMNGILIAFADIPFVLFVLLPGLVPWWPGLTGPLL